MLTPRTVSFPKLKPRPRFVMGMLSTLVSGDLTERYQALTYAAAVPAARRAESTFLTNILREDRKEGALQVKICKSKKVEK